LKILIYSINFAPELTGIGKYTGEMVEWLAQAGHEVRVITAPPYYPQWRITEGYANFWGRALSGNLTVYRCPLWVPQRPSALKRLLHLASFALSSFPVLLWQAHWRPDAVIVIEPPLMCAPGAWLLARLSRAKAWLHVQDFEVDAAFELGMLPLQRLRNTILNIEQWLMRGFDHISTISPNMLKRLRDKGVDPEKAVLFPNWVDTTEIFPQDGPSPLRAELGISPHKTVVLYSGNMGEKQGLETVLQAAGMLAGDTEIQFVLCGEGAAKGRLQQQYPGLPNVVWLPLQPAQRLNDLLNMADLHLLPQRADVADLVMPSKLTGMLASGRSVIAGAHPATQVAEVARQCGIAVAPENATELAYAIQQLSRDAAMRSSLGAKARAYALQHLERDAILTRFAEQLAERVR